MASAPQPGTTGPRTSKVWKVTLGGRTLVLDFNELGPGDDLLSRQQTGFPITSFMDRRAIAGDTFLILWWMARRKNGEALLNFDQVLREFPTNAALEAANPDAELVEEEEDPEA